MTSTLTPRTILNPDIAPQTMTRLLSLHDPDSGVVVCHPVPPGPRIGQLPLDVLHALGKRPKIAGWPAAHALAESYVKIWLAAEQITDLLLVRSDLFAAAPLGELVSFAREAGTRTWLIFDESSRRREATERLKARPAEQLHLTHIVQPHRKRTAARSKPWLTPSPWVARAAAIRTFTVQEFNDIDARIYAAFKATSAHISGQRQLERTSLERFLDVLTSDSVARHRHARLLGAGCALLQHGFAPELDERHTARRTVVINPTSEQAIEIRRHSSPTNAALRVLASFTDLDRTTLDGLTLDQVIETSQGVYLGGYLLRGAAGAALRAQRAHQQSRGHTLSEHLFTQAQLDSHRGPWGSGSRTPSRQLAVKLAALPSSLDISFPQPPLNANFTTPEPETKADAALLLRLLRLSPSRALALAHLAQPERAAAQRLTAAHAVRVYEGLIAASDHLRFSQFLFDTANYIARLTDGWP